MPKYLLGRFHLLIRVKNMPIEAVSNNFPDAALEKSTPDKAGSAKKKTSQSADEDARKIQELAKRDLEVRAHEAAHAAAGGQYVRGGATFQYQKGPDGKMYAVGGEVSIDASPIKNDPQATIMKMQTVERAAMAPAEPSGQDRAVAAAAAAVAAQARQEVAQKATGTGGETGYKKETKIAVIGSSHNEESKKTSSYNKKGDTIAFSKDVQASLLNLVV
jgi:hypothetical protein